MATAEILKRTATRPTWAQVSLENLRYNFGVVQRHIGAGITVCAVVKADAYGHGAVECARALEEEGARWLGVTSQVELLERAAAGLSLPRLPVHLKVDTGMGRLGVDPEDLYQVASALKASSHLRLEGLSTHLASSEVLDAPSVNDQLQKFEQVRSLLRNEGFDPPLVHVANTGAVIAKRESWNSMVRPGIALYGYHLPFERAGREVSGSKLRLGVKPVLTWKTRILSLRDVRANQALGYGGTYVTKAPARIAVLPVGYADGLNRALSSRGRVIVREHYAPIVGRISMDLTLADVTGLPGVSVGDEVVLLGALDGLSVDAREHSELANTNVYEILCAISKRVPRKYS